jgi:hypothetical protein
MKLPVSLPAALFLSIGIATAVDPPPFKEGLWSVHTLSIDNPGARSRENTATICRNHAYDQHVRSVAKTKAGCSTVGEGFQGGQYVIQTHCFVHGTEVQSRGATTFHGDSWAHSESRATFTPALNGITETTMTQDQRYLGNCPAGAQPGDMTNSGGAVTHLWKH